VVAEKEREKKGRTNVLCRFPWDRGLGMAVTWGVLSKMGPGTARVAKRERERVKRRGGGEKNPQAGIRVVCGGLG